MMRSFLLIAALLLSLPSFAQFGYDVSKDKENGAVVYKGEFTFEDLKKEKTFNWFNKGVADYKPDTASVRYLAKNMGGFDLVIVMGTWCDDSHNLIPKLYKVMTEAGYPVNKSKMYGVDRAKQAKGIEHKLYMIRQVPVVIVFKDQSEIGRITETVNKSIEADLARIIRKKLDDDEKAK